MNIEYPETAFAFNPVIIKCTQATGECTLSVSGFTLKRASTNGVCEFDISALAQSKFNIHDFRNIQESDKILIQSVDFTADDEKNNPQDGTVKVIWGALQIGETYNRSKTLTWFKNLPFTFPLFLQNTRNFVCETDGGAPSVWRKIETGKHNIIPNVKANETAVFYIDTKNITIELTEYNLAVDYNQTTKTIGVITNGGGFTVENGEAWISYQISGSDIAFKISESDIEYPRNADIIVRSTDDTNVFATLHITQDGAWLSQFVFDVKPASAGQTIERVINMAAIESGEAQIDWGDGNTEPFDVPQPTKVEFTDRQGNPFTVYVGKDFPHTYATTDTKQVTVKVRKGVNVFRFSSFEESANTDWGATFLPNQYITTIRKILSPSLTSGYKMFAGVVNGSFASDFPGLETPNMTDFDFMFENFGNKNTGSGYVYTSADRMRFPSNMYQNITHKDQVHKLNRTYYGSGFEKIEKHMLSCAADNALTSVFETFRQMGNVGANWTEKYGQPNNASELLTAERFLEMNIFQNQKNIKDFTGCFNAINDKYGSMGPNNYDYPLLLEPDLFMNNEADDIILDWMFNKATRAILASNFFLHLGNGQKIKSMDGCFWNFRGGSPRFSWGEYLPDYWRGARIDEHPDSLFPDASYPNMTSMVGAFGYYVDNGAKRGVGSGFNGLWAINESQTWDNTITFLNQWTFLMPSLSIAQFLSRFPNVTATSGTDNTTGNVCDGAAFNFGDWDVADGNGVTRANDFASYNARPQVKQRKLLN